MEKKHEPSDEEHQHHGRYGAHHEGRPESDDVAPVVGIRDAESTTEETDDEAEAERRHDQPKHNDHFPSDSLKHIIE